MTDPVGHLPDSWIEQGRRLIGIWDPDVPVEDIVDALFDDNHKS